MWVTRHTGNGHWKQKSIQFGRKALALVFVCHCETQGRSQWGRPPETINKHIPPPHPPSSIWMAGIQLLCVGGRADAFCITCILCKLRTFRTTAAPGMGSAGRVRSGRQRRLRPLQGSTRTACCSINTEGLTTRGGVSRFRIQCLSGWLPLTRSRCDVPLPRVSRQTPSIAKGPPEGGGARINMWAITWTTKSDVPCSAQAAFHEMFHD